MRHVLAWVLVLGFGCSGDDEAGEDTVAACGDDVDNDGDGHVDCDDQDCQVFAICVGGIDAAADAPGADGRPSVDGAPDAPAPLDASADASSSDDSDFTPDCSDCGGPAAAYGNVTGTYRGVPAYSNGGTYGCHACGDGTPLGLVCGNRCGPPGTPQTEYGIAYQCVEYVRRFYDAVYGDGAVAGSAGDAVTYASQLPAMGFTAHLSGTATSPPQPDDIVVFSGGGHGHIAIVRAVTTSTVTIIQQNASNNGDDAALPLSITGAGGVWTFDTPPSPLSAYAVVGWYRRPGHDWHACGASLPCPDGHACAVETCVPISCGNGICDPGEDDCPGSCPADCDVACGDGCCTGGETCAGCPGDCGACCGNGSCDSGESDCPGACPADCDAACGDGCCTGGETDCTCAADCAPTCGDGCCTGGETDCTCNTDCAPACGDGCCTGGETCSTCSGDCGGCSCTDPDGDGYGSGLGCLGFDCDESDPWTHEDAAEICDFKDNDCAGGGADPACGTFVRRYTECTSHHWSSNLEGTGPYCAPNPSAPVTGCALGGCSLVTCGGTSCWTAELGPGKAFNIYATQQGTLASLQTLHHCYNPNTLQNTYQVGVACNGGLVAGVPATLGLISTTNAGPPGVTIHKLYQCQWTPGSAGTDFFLTTDVTTTSAASECAGVGGTSTLLGYVYP
jgi:surface antigen